MGDSRGHRDGDTLIVDSTNLTGETIFEVSGMNLNVVERFRRLDADTLRYECMIDDPESFVRPWTAVFSTKRTEAPIFEYACHEGNCSVSNLLGGARADNRAATGRRERPEEQRAGSVRSLSDARHPEARLDSGRAVRLAPLPDVWQELLADLSHNREVGIHDIGDVILQRVPHQQ